jgi:hypothetical protein
MKELTQKALAEAFPNGASANDLIFYFKKKWGRDDIVRSSLSPQLSRLRAEGLIRRDGRLWLLAQPSEGGGSGPDHEIAAQGSSQDNENGDSHRKGFGPELDLRPNR